MAILLRFYDPPPVQRTRPLEGNPFHGAPLSPSLENARQQQWYGGQLHTAPAEHQTTRPMNNRIFLTVLAEEAPCRRSSPGPWWRSPWTVWASPPPGFPS